ncbi:hypothetical protein [Bacillus sp. FDAARGOS_235]|uniref:hypothetical protein n=1 Tax=Bacillus sp. FDAARGOS_235 TaxID=1839798 RepID=UPI0011A7A46C|nr:hypothetical protein [Bacillus sp. FDAARGOS_235]
MANACGSIWNSNIPAHASEKITKTLKYVELYIYIVPAKDPDLNPTLGDICEDVRKASKIWCNNCGITLTAAEIRTLDNNSELGLFNLSVQELEDLEAEQIDTSKSDFGNNTVDKLVNKFTPRTLGHNISKKIIIYYIEGKKFGTNGAAGYTRFKNVKFPVILLNNSTFAERLAHEVGHALFSHVNDGEDPQSPFGNDPIHNTDSLNLMHPKVPLSKEPIAKNTRYITEEQCERANDSDLVLNDLVEIGYIERFHRYLVKFTKLTCLYSHDGFEFDPLPSEDDTLEATFYFNVIATTYTGQATYTKSYFHLFDEDEEDGNKVFNPDIVIDDAEILELPTDTIQIRVSGQDDDPDDKFRVVETTLTRDDNWGNNAPPHNKFTLKSERNSNVEYEVEFTITKLGTREIPHYFKDANFCKLRDL